MARFIKVTPEIKDAIVKEFAEKLGSLKNANGKLTYTKDIGTNDRKATLLFTELAYTKIATLVNNSYDEIAWHCLAKRGDDPEKDEYIVYDVLLYPQAVTGATVTTDQEKYQTWLYEQPDEIFNNIRCQSHSHVNMGVTPSGVDEDLYEKILSQLTDDMFYIFTIHNKRKDMYAAIYDMKKNLLFTGVDVHWDIIPDGTGILALLDDVTIKVTKNTVATGYGAYNNFRNTKAAAISTTKTAKGETQKGVPKKDVKKGKSNPLTDYGDDDLYGDYDYTGYGGYYSAYGAYRNGYYD